MSKRMSALEENLQANTQALEEASQREEEAAALPVAQSSDQALPASQIYAQALEQVVGITTEVTYTNFFGQTSSSAVSGSGFIVSENGYILTNYHVIEYAYEGKQAITVMTYDGTKYEASIVGVEPSNDVAVLKIDAENLNAVSYGDSDAIAVGETVYAVGNPLGELEFSMSTGHVSALDRVISTEESESINMFQVDAAVNPGNSGGPVYNAMGQVVGMVTAKYSETGVEGLGFAIPINDAVSIANDLITKGYVTGKAYMGIRLDERYNSMYAQYYNMPLGAYVYSVDSGTCAETAGIQGGDIITKLGSTTVQSYTELKQALRQFSAGDSTTVTVYRAGEELTLNITFDEQKPSNLSDSPAQIQPAAGN
jgi:serine protease Do